MANMSTTSSFILPCVLITQLTVTVTETALSACTGDRISHVHHHIGDRAFSVAAARTSNTLLSSLRTVLFCHWQRSDAAWKQSCSAWLFTSFQFLLPTINTRFCTVQCPCNRLLSCVTLNMFMVNNKKLSYRRETARQLPTLRGARPCSPPPSVPSGYTYAYGRIRNLQQTYVKHAVH